MRSQNQKIHGYYELETLNSKGSSRVNKLADNISAKIATLQTLKSLIINQAHPELKDTTNFKKQVMNFKALIQEFNTVQTETETEDKLKQRTIKRANDFLQDLHPEQVERKIVDVEKQITRKVNQQQQQQLTLSPLQRQQLQNDKKYLKQIQSAVEIVKNMVTEIGHLVHDQRQQLQIGFKNMTNAKGSTTIGKDNVREAVGYEQDTNRRTYMCCLLITVIVLLILLIVYATHRRS